MSYRVVHDYYRREIFELFSPYQSPFWAVTFELEITRLLEYLRRHEYPIYLNLCYFLNRAIRDLEDFRYRLVDGEIVLFDELHPALTVPAAGGKFRFTYYDFHADPAAFNRRAAEKARGDTGEVLLEAPSGRAWIFFSSLPGVPFTGLTHAIRDNDDCEPRLSFGRFREDAGRTWVPVGLQVNHRVVDGRPVADLVERVQREYDDPGTGGTVGA